MRLNSFDDDIVYVPRAQRVSFDMQVRYRHGGTRATLLLQNLTAGGAYATGLAELRCGDRITLCLPSLKPKDAVVVWLEDEVLGLEFDRPLHPDIYEGLVLHHATWRTRTDADRAWQVKGKDASAPVEGLRNAA